MITSAPLELTIEGVKYDFYPLTFEDFEWLELKLRARAIEAGRMAGVDMEVVLRQSQSIDVFNELDSLQSPIVLAWMLHRMLRRSAPPVASATIESWLRTPDIRDKILSHLSVLCGTESAGKKELAGEMK